MNNEYSQEIQDYIKSKLLQPGDVVTLNFPNKPRAFGLGPDRQATASNTLSVVFKGFPEVYRGRLAADPSAPGVEPGKYKDRCRVTLETTIAIPETEDSEASEFSYEIEADLEDIILDPIVAAQRQMELGPNHHFISLAADKLSDLPETLHMEGDIVALVDKDHPEYSTNQDDNQFTVYRVYYETAEASTPKYRLRAGKNQFDATEDQLQFLSAGPVRLFYSGEGYKLLWPSIKEEAEFHLLLGRFTKIYNPSSKSYVWDNLDLAKQLIDLGKAHAILQNKLDHYLVNFWDADIGNQLSSYPDVILDI